MRQTGLQQVAAVSCPLWQVKIDAVELRRVRKFYAIGDNKLHATKRSEGRGGLGAETGAGRGQGAALWACPCLGKSLKLRL